jgi:hypothetical protein
MPNEPDAVALQSDPQSRKMKALFPKNLAAPDCWFAPVAQSRKQAVRDGQGFGWTIADWNGLCGSFNVFGRFQGLYRLVVFSSQTFPETRF